MNRLLGLLAIGIVSHVLVEAATTQPGRVIPFDRKVPIVERISPNDTTVVVKKFGFPPLVGAAKETLQEEIQRLTDYQTIAILDVLTLDGQLVDDGTWVRTEVRAKVRAFARDRLAAAQGGFVTMSHDGGKVRIRNTVIDAGVYPVFSPGEQYLVFLAHDRVRNSLSPSGAFRVDQTGVLRAMQNSDGSLILPNSNLIGRNAAEIQESLAAK